MDKGHRAGARTAPDRRRRLAGFLSLLVASLIAGARGSDARAGGADDPRAVAPGEPVAIGRVLDAGPGARGLSLLTAGGYGYTEAVLGLGDRHHRLAGRLVIDDRLLPWLAVALRLDGRYDRHTIPGQPDDSGYVGDPRIQARVDRALGAGVAVGARAVLWLPGGSAPSIRWDALTPELVAAMTFTPAALPLSVSANAGYRLDRSARSAGDAARLSAGDRLALGVSAFDAVLLGASASLGRARLQGFVEGSWELLVGSGHPSALASPIIVGAGARAAIRPRLRVEAAVEVSPSSRPNLAPGAPLVVVPPRLAFWLGLTYRFGGAGASGGERDGSAAPVAPPAPAAPSPVPPAPAEATPSDGAPPAAPGTPSDASGDDGRGGASLSGQLRGLVRSFRGSAVIADVEIHRVGSAETSRQTLRAEAGRFQVDVAPGTYEIRIEAPGYESQRRRVAVERNGVTLLNVDLKVAR